MKLFIAFLLFLFACGVMLAGCGTAKEMRLEAELSQCQDVVRLVVREAGKRGCQ